MSLQERILKHINILPNGCWVWNGVLISNRYPGLRIEGKLTSVRRLVYDLWGLRPELGKAVVRATCLNECCINPTHLVKSMRKKGGNLHNGRTPRSNRYPWSKWLRKKRFSLTRYQDFTCEVHSMGMQLRQQANKHHLKLHIQMEGNTLTITQESK